MNLIKIKVNDFKSLVMELVMTSKLIKYISVTVYHYK